MKRSATLIAVLTFGTLFLTMCGEEAAGPGRALIKWEIKGKTCDLAGVVKVQVTLEQGGEPTFTEDALCSDAQLVLSNVPAGDYDVRVIGFDEDGMAIYEAFGEGLEVKEGAEPSSLPILELEKRRGTIRIIWTFPEHPGIVSCSAIGVDHIDITVSQTDNDYVIFAGDFPCNLDADAVDLEELPAPVENGYVVIADVPEGQIDLIVYGRNEAGDKVYAGITPMEMRIGESIDEVVELNKCNGNCN